MLNNMLKQLLLFTYFFIFDLIIAQRLLENGFGWTFNSYW